MVHAANKRIAKNTLLLYGRMFVMMLIGLYTSRVVLNALGVEDYGIYNVVGGVVSMFSVLSRSMSSAISRFITFELGKGDIERLKRVFCTSINIQIVFIVVITILLETVGLWFLNNKMVVSAERLSAANWLFQFSVITFAVNLWSVPYNATIIAHERMSAFAYISIFDAMAKLAIAFVILKNPIDRLVYYGVLVLMVGLMQRALYASYCRKHFDECKYHFVIDREITKEMSKFAGWNFIGSSSVVLRDQGGNIIINLFYGPVVNAARGIAMSVNSAVSNFVTNFQTALKPQITKEYASGNNERVFRLVFQGTRFSYYILLIIALPIIFTAPYLLHIWLGVVPNHSVTFTCLVLIFSLCESLSGPLITLMLATGDIRNYQLVVGGCQLLNLPISYILLKMGYPPESIFVVAIAISFLCEMTRLIMLRRMVMLSVRRFLKEVFFNAILVSILASILPFLAKRLIGLHSFITFILVAMIAGLSAVTVIYAVGCNQRDRALIRSGIHDFILAIKHDSNH